MNCNVPNKEKDCPVYHEGIKVGYCRLLSDFHSDEIKNCSHRKRCIRLEKAYKKGSGNPEADYLGSDKLPLLEQWEKEKK